MTDKRLPKAKRVLKVQEQLHEIAEWRLAGLQRRATEVREAQASLMETLNDEAPLHGLFVEPAARRLRALAVQESEVKQEQERQAQVVLDHAMSVKRTERMVATLAIDARRALEKKADLAQLDLLANRRDADLP